MIHKIYKSTVALIVPLFFMNTFPAYRIFPDLLLGALFVWGAGMFIRHPLSEIPAKWHRPLTAATGIVVFLIVWLLHRTPATSVGTRLSVSTVLAYYPFLDSKSGSIFKLSRIKIYVPRLLCAALIALLDAALCLLDPLSLLGSWIEDGRTVSLIVLLSAYSFALTQVFYRLERRFGEEGRGSGKDGGLYGVWLILPAFTTSCLLLFWFWPAKGVLF
ncbi:MAG: hypothetical protein LBP73_01840 [Clostridiales Family XIII bacterium]|jgi:hypothetical protein|nr:hypothetical protein [Clostridiales Family XIII bacterium]